MWFQLAIMLGIPLNLYLISFHFSFIQVVPNATTTAKIHKDAGTTAAFSKRPLKKWLQSQNTKRLSFFSIFIPLILFSASSFNSALQTFVRSCAGCSVATYVIGMFLNTSFSSPHIIFQESGTGTMTTL